MCLIIHSLAFDISEKFMTVMGMGIGNSGMGKNGNGNRFLSWEWVGMGMGMVLWEWEGMGTEIVLPAHLYLKPTPCISINPDCTATLFGKFLNDCNIFVGSPYC